MSDENVIPQGKKVAQIYEALLSRAQLAARLGYQYDSNRDLYRALGYKTNLTFEDFAVKWTRQDIAKAIINRPVEATWRGEFYIQESDKENETALEKAWEDIDKQFKLKQIFVRLDKLSSMGKYGVLLLGFSDVKNITDMEKPIAGNALKLVYVKPLSEQSAEVMEYENNQADSRYGMPKFYNVTIKYPNSSSTTQRVHWSRVIHVTGETLESEVDGVPVLEAVYNRLDDLEKLVGSSAEMFWRGARPGMYGKLDADSELSAEDKEALQDQVDEFENNLRRFLILSGVELKDLQMKIADPQQHVDVQIQMISAVTGIPKRILVGSERGELASSEDKGTWFEIIKDRRENYAELQIVVPFVDRLQSVGAMPPSESFDVIWDDLFAPSIGEKVEIGLKRAQMVKEYTTNPDSRIILPEDAFYRNCFGADEDELELIRQEHETAMAEEKKAQEDEEAAMVEAEQQAQAQLAQQTQGRDIPTPNRPPRQS